MKRSLLFLTNALNGGGAEKVLHTIITNLSRDAYDVTLVSLLDDDWSSYPEWIKKISIFKKLNNRGFFYNLYVKFFNKAKLIIYNNLSSKWFYNLFIPKNRDVEIAFIEGYATRILGGSTSIKAMKLAWVHTDLINNHWTIESYRNTEEERDSYSRYDKVICVSQSVKASMKSLFPELDSLTVHYNPVDGAAIRLMSEEPIDDINFIKGTFTMVSLGRLVPQKGYDRLLPVLKRLHDEGYGFVMNILGEGPDRAKLMSYINDNAMNGYLRLLGFKSNPYPYLCASDLFVCSSRVEGYNIAVLEALILGVPVLTTNCAEMEELVNNKYGIVVENEEESLYNGLKSLLVDSAFISSIKDKLHVFKDVYRFRIEDIYSLFNP